MDRYVISGGAPLRGEVRLSGSKNAALAIMAGAILTSDPVILHNVPRINDIFIMVAMLRRLGIEADFISPRALYIDSSHIQHTDAPEDLVTRMRASFCVAGPLVTRYGSARIPLPGGCDIGARPVDYHIKGLRQLGARVEMRDGYVSIEASRLKGTTIYLDFPSVGATQHLITAAVMAQGDTVIEDAATEPDVCDLVRFLVSLGARITGAGTRRITVHGVPRLKGGEYTIIPDRIEGGTLAIAAAATQGSVHIVNADADALRPVTYKLREAGVHVDEPPAGGVTVTATKRLKPFNIKTGPYPGFPTDMQQPAGAMLSIAEGISVITETVYERRFRYMDELAKMGADITRENRTAIIRGVPKLHGARINATDLRAGAALVVAGLAADGETTINDIRHIDRGYELLENKLTQLGADIRRVSDEDASGHEKETALCSA